MMNGYPESREANLEEDLIKNRDERITELEREITVLRDQEIALKSAVRLRPSFTNNNVRANYPQIATMSEDAIMMNPIYQALAGYTNELIKQLEESNEEVKRHEHEVLRMKKEITDFIAEVRDVRAGQNM